jgi:lipopolysaccharide/colanic/teichoic acid biosynthesis glycosyltransferase
MGVVIFQVKMSILKGNIKQNASTNKLIPSHTRKVVFSQHRKTFNWHVFAIHKFTSLYGSCQIASGATVEIRSALLT